MAFGRNLTATQWKIVRAFCDGDIEAGIKVMDKYSVPIRSYLEKLNYGRYADDWMQLIYLKVIDWVTDPRFDPDTSHFRSLVHTCIHRTIADQMKKLGRQPLHVSIYNNPEAEKADRLIWNEVYYDGIRTEGLAEVKSKADPQHWAAFEAWNSGKSPAEIAAEFGQTTQWFYGVKSRLLQMLREICLELDKDAI